MNINKFTVFWLAVAVSAPLCFAKDPAQTQQKTTQPGAATTAMQKDCRLSKLLKAEVTSNTAEKLGDVEDVAINPANGKIDFLILGKGGFLDIGEKYVPVPWDKVTSTSSKELALSVTKQDLKAAPKVSKDLTELRRPEFIAKVYQHFGETSKMGAAETPGGKANGASTSSATMQKTHSSH